MKALQLSNNLTIKEETAILQAVKLTYQMMASIKELQESTRAYIIKTEA